MLGQWKKQSNLRSHWRALSNHWGGGWELWVKGLLHTVVREQIEIYSYTVNSGKNMLVNGRFDFPEVLWDIIWAEKRPIFHSMAQRKADPVSREKDTVFSQVKSPKRGTQGSLRACDFSSSFTMDKPPCCQGRQQMSRLTNSVFPLHKKFQIAVETLVWTQSGILTTLAMYQRPEAPSVLIIMDLPFKDKVLERQRLRPISSWVTRSAQLAWWRLTLPI